MRLTGRRAPDADNRFNALEGQLRGGIARGFPVLPGGRGLTGVTACHAFGASPRSAP